MASGRKRGRLSSIDLLPEEAEPFIAEALAELRKRKKPQSQILQVLNLKLGGIGVGPISKSAFNRKALWLAAYGAQLENAREIAAVVGERLEAAPEGDVGLLLGETLKTLIFDVLSEASLSDKSPSMQMLNMASESLQFLERARKMSVETRSKIESEFRVKAEKAVDQVAKEKGLGADTVAAIKSQILGLRAVPAEPRESKAAPAV